MIFWQLSSSLEYVYRCFVYYCTRKWRILLTAGGPTKQQYYAQHAVVAFGFGVENKKRPLAIIMQ